MLQAGAADLKKVTKAWQEGRISNFDYLLFCNVASGRSFSDLTQYCVFPWVLSDYASKELDLDSPASFRDLSLPMGAMDPQRLSVLVRRFREMPREEVLFWLYAQARRQSLSWPIAFCTLILFCDCPASQHSYPRGPVPGQ